MSEEEKKDLRLALIVVLLALFIGVFIGRASVRFHPFGSSSDTFMSGSL